MFSRILIAAIAYGLPVAMAAAWRRQAAYRYYRLHPDKRDFFGSEPARPGVLNAIWPTVPMNAFVTRDSIWRVRHPEPALEAARLTLVFRERVVAAIALLGWFVVLVVMLRT